MSSLEATERMSAESAVSPTTRVSLADINDNIAAEYFMTGDKMLGPDVPIAASLRVLTICVLVMRNGFTIIGKAAPADERNFNPDLGMKFAREDAVRQCWPIMGYELRERLYRSSQP